MVEPFFNVGMASAASRAPALLRSSRTPALADPNSSRRGVVRLHPPAAPMPGRSRCASPPEARVRDVAEETPGCSRRDTPIGNRVPQTPRRETSSPAFVERSMKRRFPTPPMAGDACRANGRTCPTSPEREPPMPTVSQPTEVRQGKPATKAQHRPADRSATERRPRMVFRGNSGEHRPRGGEISHIIEAWWPALASPISKPPTPANRPRDSQPRLQFVTDSALA